MKAFDSEEVRKLSLADIMIKLPEISVEPSLSLWVPTLLDAEICLHELSTIMNAYMFLLSPLSPHVDLHDFYYS